MKRSISIAIFFAVAFTSALCGFRAEAAGFKKLTVIVCDTTRSEGTLRVLYWNIQNGMWSDQGNNYDKFVEWVRKYNPDVCVWCESQSHYTTGTIDPMPESERYLPDGWPELAARYGHSYTALGGWRDDYPQMVTSKFPIETVLKITDTDDPEKPVSHGSAIQSIKVGDLDIYFLTVHLWPRGYAYGVPEDQMEQNAMDNGGDYYRLYEISYILDHTVNSPDFSSHEDWVMLGDFNSLSTFDNWEYGLPVDSPALLTQSYIHDHTDLLDVIANKFKGQFVNSTQSTGRIDYVHASPSMYKRIDKAMTVTDDWTVGWQFEKFPNAYYPSDHLPILIDFNLK